MQAQNGFHRQFPAGLDLECVEQPGGLDQALGGEPGGGLAIAVGDRRLLESGEGGLAASGGLKLGASRVQTGDQVTPLGLLLAQGRRQPVPLTAEGRQLGV
jgi:hypothetical protein